MSGVARWEADAERWIAWARAPGHDSYWYYRDGFFDEIVGPPGARTLDMACGEGRVTRDLTERGHRVTGVDASPTLLRAAHDADPGGRYVRGDATRLPLADASFDVVVAYNCLMDLDDMPAGAAEAARVLAPGGALCVSITHPFQLAGRFASREPGAPFVVDGSYLEPPGGTEFVAERDGLTMTFRDHAYPLERWASAFEGAGLVIARLREPPSSDAALARYGDSDRRWRRMPVFLQIRALKPR